VRLAVYTDYPYRRDHDGTFAERAFVLFLGELANHVDRLVLLGRLDPEGGRGDRSHYRVSDAIEFVPLPHYESLASPLGAARAMAASTRAFARVLDDVDAAWLLGPHPLCLAFAAQAAARRRAVILGVRQDLPRYARTRHPDRRAMHWAADALEASYRLLSRRYPAIVVGPELARNYSHARAVLPMSVSLVHERDLPRPADLPERSWEGPVQALSVGRLEAEKNPLMLADVLARLDGEPAWRLAVCGEGPLEGRLRERLEALGVADRSDLRGYVPIDGGLGELYRDSHALLHVSWTEGVPQILFEAFAAGLPVVATAVGGVPESVGDDALLVPAGDPEAAAGALRRLAGDAALRERLVSGGLERVRRHTIEAEAARVAKFLSNPASGAD
jgi:glycosyltransferase involved in cell wall biosynthesis